MGTRRERTVDAVPARGVQGLPPIRYRLPIVVTTLAAMLIALVTGLFALITLGIVVNSVTRTAAEGASDPVFVGCVCAPLGLTLLGGTIFFLGAIIQGLRDLFQPVHYTRGTVAEREHIGVRRGANWLYVDARYAGPDLAVASEVTDEQRAASPDRSQIVQPRFTPEITHTPTERAKERQGSYLPAHRLTEDLKALESREPGSTKPPLIFRIDPSAHAAIKPDDEVLVAHSPYLQHVYYVSHLRGGEWESFPNKALI